jgi:5-(carboxyamino)imidazole ribonucleotide synthase
MANASNNGSRHIGIVGGGQLALMLCHAARRLGHRTTVLDPDPAPPAQSAADRCLRGSLHDPAALGALAANTDLVTIELENVGVEALAALAAGGSEIVPAPALLLRLVNKLEQKTLLRKCGIPTSDFVALERPSPDAVAAFGLPCVQKLQRGGYDGRGVHIVREPADLAHLLTGPSLIERFVTCRGELAVVVARTAKGSIDSFPPVELTFDSARNVLDALVAPARVDDHVATDARRLAERTVAAIGGVGVFGVELFLSDDGALLVNEVSPRVHNSGHHTMEACVTSQFEQHVRILTGAPLGDMSQRSPAAMVNLLGEAGSHGDCVIAGIDEARTIDGVHVHWYGKRECRPGRKMGHVTALADTADGALTKARAARALIHIKGAIADG